MARKIIPAVSILLLLLVLSGCESPETHFAVLQGNYVFARGEYPQATFSYLDALSSGRWENRIHYNLGNVYYELGEESAAFREWEAALSGQDAVLDFRIAFNRGVLLYEQARYQEAYDAFRRALSINSSSIDAKINLEHSLRKISRGRQEQQIEPATGGGSTSGESERILDYVRRSKQSRWTPGFGEGDSEGGKTW
jgi:Ca-activated chloride channel family protein